jgi:EAL and modified HD-GYP domain-containing signal transduction protein
MPPQDIAVITQPLVDRRGRTVGHEVLFGGGGSPAGLDSTVNRTGTAALLLSVFGGLGLQDVVGDEPAWLSISHEFVLGMGTLPVRPDRVVLQLRDVFASPELGGTVERLAGSGYTIALDRFDGRVESIGPCSVVKVDVRGRPDSELAAHVAAARVCGAEVVASGVASEEAYERCVALGFDVFQGAAVASSRLVRQRLAGVCSERSLQALRAVSSDPDADDDLERLIASDPGLALTLLRYVGSAYAAPPALSSVRDALDLLGPRMVRCWATLVAAGVPAHAREEHGARAVRRAAACEAASGAVSPADRASYFTVGLLSVAGDLVGAPLEDVVAGLPLAPDVRTAIVARAGRKGERLAAVLRYERAAAA